MWLEIQLPFRSVFPDIRRHTHHTSTCLISADVRGKIILARKAWGRPVTQASLPHLPGQLAGSDRDPGYPVN
jgi:hypothetical protein